MDNLAPPGLNNNQNAAANRRLTDAHLLGIQRCVQVLVHTGQCRTANCSVPSCQKMKGVVQHMKGCEGKMNDSCRLCKQLIALCCYHAKHCQERACGVPLCPNIKKKIRQQELQDRLQQYQMLRRRMISRQREGQPGGAGLPSPAANNGAGPGSLTSASTQPSTPQAPTQGNMSALSQQQGVGMGNPGLQQQVQQHGGTFPAQHSMMGHMAPQQQPGVPQQQQQMMNQQQQPRPGSRVLMQVAGMAVGAAGAPAALPAALLELLHVLRSPRSPLQQQQVLNILRSNPTLMDALVRQRAARYQDQRLRQQPQMLRRRRPLAKRG